MGKAKKFFGKLFRPRNIIKVAVPIAAAVAAPAAIGIIAGKLGASTAATAAARAATTGNRGNILSKLRTVAMGPTSIGGLLSRSKTVQSSAPGKLLTSVGASGGGLLGAASKVGRLALVAARHPFLTTAIGSAAFGGFKLLSARSKAHAVGRGFAEGIGGGRDLGDEGAQLITSPIRGKQRVKTITRGRKMGIFGRARGTRGGISSGQVVMMPHRRRHAGVTGRDIKGASRVARLVKRFGFKPKFAPRKHKR